jgi:hypothetical protein
MQLVGVAPLRNDPVTPLGRPEKLNVTVLVNPFSGVKVSVLLADAPCATLSVAGAADSVKVGGRETVRVTAVLLVRAPEVPVMVTIALTAAADPVAAKVTGPAWPAATAPNVAVTPGGSPETASATVALNPFWLFTEMLVAPVAPALIFKLAGVAESVKLAGAATLIAMVVWLVIAPELPVTVMTEDPGIALAAACKVSVVERVADAGLNIAVTPAGRPLTAKATALLKLPIRVTVIVLGALPPCGTLRLAGDDEML